MRYQIRMHPTLELLVSSIGEVYFPPNGTHKGHWTFGCDDGQGYRVVLSNNKHYKVHRLVAETFLPNDEDKPFIDHKNRNRSDNVVDNLRWCTPSENMRNTPLHDQVDARDGIHHYANPKEYWRARDLRRRQEHPEKLREKDARHNRTHKRVKFSDGSRHWMPNDRAYVLLAIPVRERVWITLP